MKSKTNIAGKRTYKKYVHCTNCDFIRTISVPFGEWVIDFMKRTRPKCENCGCYIMYFGEDK